MRLRDLLKREQNPDRRVIRELRRVADLTRPRQTTFYLYLPTHGAADAAASAARARGYGAVVQPSATDATAWCMIAARELVVDEASIAEARTVFEQIASDHAGEYDGWEAAIDE